MMCSFVILYDLFELTAAYETSPGRVWSVFPISASLQGHQRSGHKQSHN